jgi:hypothetical protein
LLHLLKSNPKEGSSLVLVNRTEKYWECVAQCGTSGTTAVLHCRRYLSGSNEKRLEAVLLISWLSSMVLLVQYLRSKI